MIIVLWIFADFIEEIEPLQLDFSYEGLFSASDLNSIGTREGGGEVDVALDIDVSREDDIVILIQELHGAAQGMIRGRQGVAVKIKDGDGYRGAGTITFRRSRRSWV